MGPAVVKLERPKWPVIVKLLALKAVILAALMLVLKEVESLEEQLLMVRFLILNPFHHLKWQWRTIDGPSSKVSVAWKHAASLGEPSHMLCHLLLDMRIHGETCNH